MIMASEASASQKKKIIIRQKQPLDPPSPNHQLEASTQDPTSDKSWKGGGGVPTPGPPSGSLHMHATIFTLPVFSATINIRKILTFNFP